MSPDLNDPVSPWNPSYKVFGADTSLWSLEVDFDKYKAAGAAFVIIKALHGTDIDPYFSRNYARAREAGILLSTYQWLLPDSERPIQEQVQTYADLQRDYPHDFVPWLDYEGDVGPRDLICYLKTFQQLTGRQIGVYSSFARLSDAVPALPEEFSSLSLWIAQYSANYPPVPRPFKNWDFWQFTESMPGESFGFTQDGEHLVDMNYFNGTMDTFLAFCDPLHAGTPEEQLQQRIQWEVPAPPLASGDTGIQVLKLQDLLVRTSFMTNAQVSAGPGIFGPRTKVALINMQAALGLPSSGLYGDDTRSAVISRYYTLKTAPPIEVTPSAPIPDDRPVEERLQFNGNAVYKRYVARLSRGDVQYHVLRVDLTNAEIFITPQPAGLSMVPVFLEKHGMDIAMNGDGWTISRSFGATHIQTTGENASRGQVYGRKGNQASFYIDERNRVSIRRPAGKDIWNALSFPNLLVEGGRISSGITRADIDPRTALGFTRDGRHAILVTVDGRETYSASSRSGMNFLEVASILVRHGAWIGSNQDGGGSTTLAIRDERDGAITILNDPCGESPFMCRGKLYTIRPVANHFGIRFLASTPPSGGDRPPGSLRPGKDEL
jgi:GH25 family lysozyme M1 (1,4-beta-N-acetylmuramidase)